VLIDVEGRVRDVVVAKESGESESFGRAAKEAALKTVWKPAISNGQPVAVWITYKVSFRLK
jgi:TonB family protein